MESALVKTHLYHLLLQWHRQKDDLEWVLGTLYQVSGSAYRKPGSFMLFNDLGQHYGLLSGGCLESNLQRHAHKVMRSQQTMAIQYDSSDEDDPSYQLGLGCGGIIDILLQPINSANNYLELTKVYQAIDNKQPIIYNQTIETKSNEKVTAKNKTIAPSTNNNSAIPRFSFAQHAEFKAIDKRIELSSWITAPPHILIVGGGIDAIPLSDMAKMLGWEVTLADPRPTNARREHFQSVNRISNSAINTLNQTPWFTTLSAAIVMAHNIPIDADALKILCHSNIQYCALLGPKHRKNKVLAAANIKESDLPCQLNSPAGLKIAADLPESIALAILAECHHRLFVSNNELSSPDKQNE